MATILDGDPQSLAAGPGGRYSRDAALLALQAPTSGAPRSSRLDTVTDPLLPPKPAAARLAHFFEGLYDLRPESHLARLLKVLLGDAGAGQLRKRYLVSRMASVVLTTRFGDLDRFYGSLLRFARLSGESLDVSPYVDAATPEEWEQIDARDARYRSRVEQFSRAIPWAATPTGMSAVGEALLSAECQVYETWSLLDETGGSVGGSPPPVGARTYGDVETFYVTHQAMQVGSYADIEGGTGSFGRTATDNRAEFILRPLRQISLEEAYRLTQVLTRLKPARALLTVDASGVAVHSPIAIRDVSASSTYWEVRTRVVPALDVARFYQKQSATPVTQPRPAFSGYQGEAWSYNADIVATTSYAESATGATLSTSDYERTIGVDGRPVDLTPDRGLADPEALMRGRVVSDGVLLAAPYSSDRVGVAVP